MILAKSRMRMRHRSSRDQRCHFQAAMSSRHSSPEQDFDSDEEDEEPTQPLVIRGLGASRRRSMLCDAVRHGAPDTVASLLQNGADVNELGFGRGYGEPALVSAVRYEHYHLVPMLLNEKANVNQPNERGHTALIRACQKNHTETIRLLLDHGADANALDSSRLSALYWAVKNNQAPVVGALLACGAVAELTLQHCTTALHQAAAAESPAILQLLLKRTKNLNTVDDFGETPLFSALRANHFDTTSALLNSGASANIANSDLRTPLHMAAANVHQNVDLVQLLLDHGACVNVVDRYGHTPLVLSLRDSFFNHRSNFTVPEALVRHGSLINEEHCIRSLGWSVLSHGNFDLVRMAVNAGFKIRGVDWIDEFLKGDPGRRRWYTSNHYDENEEKAFIDFLKSRLSQPLSLADTCRLQVRNVMSGLANRGSIYYSIQQLPLPQPLIMFLLLED